MLQNKNQYVIKIKIGVIYVIHVWNGVRLIWFKKLGFLYGYAMLPHGLAHKYKKKNPTTQARSLSPSWKEVMDASKIPVVSCCDGIWIVLQD